MDTFMKKYLTIPLAALMFLGKMSSASAETMTHPSCTASADNVSVTGYKVFRNGTQIATVTTTSCSNTSLYPTSYLYTVAAHDAAGSVSSQSSAASARTRSSDDPTICTALSIDCVVSQNSGYDTGIYPYGVPTHFSWYAGGSAASGNSAPPSDFSSLTGWGQIYPQVGASNVAANVYLKDYRVYVHLTSGGWRLVQDQAANSVGGQHFVADFSNNSSSEMSLVVQSPGSIRMESPASGYNNHFWMDPRGSYTPGTVNGVFSIAQLRTDSASANLIANFGGDWWRSASAPYLQQGRVFVNNPGIGMGSWVKLTTTYQYFFFTTMTKSQLQTEPPPPLR
jgi:hypothetical protein